MLIPSCNSRGGGRSIKLMDEFVQGIRRNWTSLLAFALIYAAIMLNLGPAWAVAVWFLNGCAYIIFLALRN